MRLKNVVLCDSASCGAILRIGGPEPALSVNLEEDVAGLYFVCPRCRARTYLDPVEGTFAPRRKAASRPLRS
jgi:hypothetical protein